MTNYATTVVYDDYWRFAAERQSIYEKRLTGAVGAWTQDPILTKYKFTNSYRASDRVSQYLIRHVQYRDDRSSDPREVFFRTMLFKIFNKIETWELIEQKLGPVSIATGLTAIQDVLDAAFAEHQHIYSAAYVMPAPLLGEKRKHANHMRLLEKMLASNLALQLANSASLEAAYEILLALPGIGKFLAFQYAIDLNYSTLMNHDEAEFVVAGPGAHDGVAKCFEEDQNPEEIIHHMVSIQDVEFARLGLKFKGLFGRKLQPIDCQNLFCEISKYARVAHPEIIGDNNRTKIKQNFKQHPAPLAQPFFPPKWNLAIPEIKLTVPENRGRDAEARHRGLKGD